MGATPSAPNPRGHGPKNLKNNQNGKVIGDTHAPTDRVGPKPLTLTFPLNGKVSSCA